MKLTPITSPLDKAIAPLVHALRSDGFDTFASCDGTSDEVMGPRVPWVAIRPYSQSRGRLCPPSITQARLLEWLAAHEIDGNVCHVLTQVGAERIESFRIEVFSNLAKAQL